MPNLERVVANLLSPVFQRAVLSIRMNGLTPETYRYLRDVLTDALIVLEANKPSAPPPEYEPEGGYI